MFSIWVNVEYMQNENLNIIVIDNEISAYENNSLLFKNTSLRVLDTLFYITVNNFGKFADNLFYNHSIDVIGYSFLVKPGGKIYNCPIEIDGFYRDGNDLIRNFPIVASENIIGIRIPTHQRKNGNSPGFLRRSISSVLSQSDEDFKLFVMGDKYEDKEELVNIISSFNDERIILINLPVAFERNSVRDNTKRWRCAGVTTCNYSIILMRYCNFNIVCHLDDDDEWKENHLSILRSAYSLDEKVFFAYSRCNYLRKKLPVETRVMELNNLRPRKCNIIHSNVSWKIKGNTLLYKLSTEDPVDALMWGEIANYVDSNNLYYVYNSTVTSVKNEDGFREDSIGIFS